MTTYVHKLAMRRASIFGALMLISAWAVALSVPLTRYADATAPAGQFFRTHHSGFAPLYALLGAQSSGRAITLMLIAGSVYAVMALFYWSLVQRLAAHPDTATLLWHSRAHWLVLGGVWLGWALAYPLLSDDALYYVVNARAAWVYHLNPYLPTTLSAIRNDAWHTAIGPINSLPFTYGPMWLYLSVAVVAISGSSLVFALLGVKLLVIVALLACISILRLLTYDNGREPSATLAILWHPLVALELLWSSHNDVVMMLLLLLTLLTLRRGYPVAAICLLMLGVATKFIPLICLPLVIAAAIQETPDTRARWRIVLYGGIGGAIVLVLAFAPILYDVGFVMFTGLIQQSARVNPSIGALIQHYVLAPFNPQLAQISLPVLLLLAIGYYTWRVWNGLPLADALIMLLLGYALVLSTWYVPWYGLWPLMLAPLAQPWLRRAVVLSTLLLPFYYIVNILPLPAWLLVLFNAVIPLMLIFAAWHKRPQPRLAITASGS